MPDGDDPASIFRGLFKSGVVVFAGFVVEMGIAFLAKTIVARELARANYGSIAAGVTVLTTVSTLAILGLNNGIGRYLPRFDESKRRRGVFFSALQMAVPVALASAAGLFAFAPLIARVVFNAPDSTPVLQVFALAVPFVVLTKLAIGGVQGAGLTLPKVYIQNLTLPVSRFALVASFVVMGLGVVGIAWAYVLPHVVAAVVGLWMIHRYTDLFEATDHAPYRRELLSFSLPLIVVGMMSRIFIDLDTYLIGYFIGLDALGTYDIAYTLGQLLLLVMISFNYLTQPILSRLHSESRIDGIRRIYTVVTKWILFGTLPLFLGVFLFPELAISTTFGDKYANGALALRILAVGFLFEAAVGPNDDGLSAFGRTRHLMYYNVVAAVLNVGLNLALIPRFGIAGAAVATLFAYVVLNLLHSIDLYRISGASPVSAEVLRPSAVTAVLVTGMYLLADALIVEPLLVFVAVLFPSAVLYPAVIVRFGGVGETEIMIVESVEDRFGVDLDRVKRVFDRLR